MLAEAKVVQREGAMSQAFIDNFISYLGQDL